MTSIANYFVLAIKNLKHRGIRSWLTLLGIVIGVAVVVSLIFLGNGLKLAVMNQFGMGSSEMISVQAGGLNSFGPPGSGVTKPLDIEDLEEIEKLPSVKKVIRRNIESGQMTFEDESATIFTTNIPLEERRFLYEFLQLEMENGRFFEGGDIRKVVLGYNFYIGKSAFKDKIITSGKRITLNGERFEVIGITKRKGSFITDNIVYLVDEDMQRVFDIGDRIEVIAVQPDSREKIEQTKLDIEKALRRSRNVEIGEEDFEVSTPEASLSSINQIITGVQIFIILVAAISIIVGIVGIVNTMTTSVLERRRDIGIMKAIAAKNSQRFLQSFVESGMLGLVGGIVGVLLGTLMGWAGITALGNFLSTDLTLEIDWLVLGGVFIGSFLIGGLAGISPAMQAAKQNPVEALR